MTNLLRYFAAWPMTLWRLACQIWRELWLRVVVMGAFALVALGLAQLTGAYLPAGLSDAVPGSAADRLLSIIANAMLAVVTFSLTVMVTVYRSTSQQFTPRVHRLIIQDRTTQNTLATFIGAYVYALVGIILRELGIFDDDKALVLFVVTVLVLTLVVYSMVRWVIHLQNFGSLADATRQVEDITHKQFAERLARPCLGANPWDGQDLPDGASPILAKESGYVQQIFQESLNECAAKANVELYLAAEVGNFVLKGEPLAHRVERDDQTTDDPENAIEDVVCAHMLLGDMRIYEQDPRLGLIVLGEIASKALSPGINDPGTAIDITTRVARIVSQYHDEQDNSDTAEFPQLWIKRLQPKDLMRDGFGALNRDGAAVIEVQVMLQKVLRSLAHHDSAPLARAAESFAQEAYDRAFDALTFEPERQMLRAAAGKPSGSSS